MIDEERMILLGKERELRRATLAGAYLPGKRREDLLRPLGKGKAETIQGGREVGRNAPCPCGSGRKYKHCCRDVDGKAWTHRKRLVTKDHGADGPLRIGSLG